MWRNKKYVYISLWKFHNLKPELKYLGFPDNYGLKMLYVKYLLDLINPFSANVPLI